MRCKYCVIDFDNPKVKNYPYNTELIDKIKYLLNSPLFLSKYPVIQISFFGGEPTMNLDGMKEIVNAFIDNPRVTYFLYSNGVNYTNKTFELFESMKSMRTFGVQGENTPKFLIQFSYDGIASHDEDRLTKSGKKSALLVKETIFEAAKRNIPFQIHPTIAHRNLNKLSENYFEFKRMSSILGIPLNYGPSIDYLSDTNFSKEEWLSIKNTLRQEFNKISSDEIEYFKKNKEFSFGWFNENRAICSAGKGYFGFDIDGVIRPCHGTFTNDDKSLEITHITESNNTFLSKILKADSIFETTLKDIPKECLNCKTHYCLKCNAAKYNFSKPKLPKLENPNFFNSFKPKAWTNYPMNKDLCDFFQYIGTYRTALLQFIHTKI